MACIVKRRPGVPDNRTQFADANNVPHADKIVGIQRESEDALHSTKAPYTDFADAPMVFNADQGILILCSKENE